MPPSPSSDTISYGPRRAPGASVKACWSRGLYQFGRGTRIDPRTTSLTPPPHAREGLGRHRRLALLHGGGETALRPERAGRGHRRTDPDRVLVGRLAPPNPPAVRDDHVRRRERLTAREGNRHRVANAAVGEEPALAAMRHGDPGKEHGNRRAGFHDVVEGEAVVGPGAEVPRRAGDDVMTANAEAPHAVVQAIEARRFELPQPGRDDAATGLERTCETAAQVQV